MTLSTRAGTRPSFTPLRGEFTAVLENVSKSYLLGEVNIPALKGITLKIPRKRFSMVLGPSGSGKTTLLNLIGCIDQPTIGKIEVCGVTVADLSDNEVSDFRAKTVGFIFQNFNLVPVLSAYENIEYPLILLGESDTDRVEMSDRIRNPEQPFKLTNRLIEYESGNPRNELRLVIYAKKDRMTGQYRTLVRYVEPPRDAGKMVLFNGSQMWFYDSVSKASVRNL